MKYDNNTYQYNNGLVTYDHRLLYTMVESKTITNTTDETSHFNDTNCIGSRTIIANSIKKGNLIRINVRSDFSCNGNPTNVLKLKLGAYTLVSSTGQLGSNHTNDYVEFNADLVFQSIGANGTIVLMGRTMISGTSDISRKFMVSTPMTIDTTINNIIDLTYTWGAANTSNILIPTTATIQIFN